LGEDVAKFFYPVSIIIFQKIMDLENHKKYGLKI